MKRIRSLALATLATAVATLVCAGCAPAHEPATVTSTNPKQLPLGDDHYTTSSPKRGYVYACTKPSGPGGASENVPWIHGGTFDSTAKATVDGSVSWSGAKVSFKTASGKLKVKGNGLPVNTTTGVFPISPSDDAYQYDRNPNSISSQSVSYSLPATPKKASKPHCLSMGPIGIATNGVAIFNALDAGGRDAIAHEVQDKCDGHPEQRGTYHYHSLSACLFRNQSKTSHSKLFGYALDGFPIFGPRGTNGKLLSNSDLDACHGHTHTVTINGKRVRTYHYHATLEYPYTLGCFMGTPIEAGQGGGQPGGGPPPGAAPPL